MRNALVTLACAATAMTSCTPADNRAVPTSDSVPIAAAAPRPLVHPEWSKNAVIYEVNIRQYTPEGTFAAFTKEIPRLKALGIDVLWIMPVQPIGKLNRKGSLGSYYSISDYTAFNPEFGTEADFKALVAAAHGQGMKVILDWVANHTAFDHEWTAVNKNWYTLKPDGSISRAIDDKGNETDWSDVADLNYSNRQMRTAMIAEMKWWLDNTGLDGFRCDMAGLVPTDFWAEARVALDASHLGMFYLAEWEDPALHASFDATYGWELFHLMNDIASAKKPTTELDSYFAKQDQRFPPTAYRLTFTSNHDENSWAGTEFERMGASHQAAYVLSATVAGSFPLLYSGQEASFKRRLKFFEKDPIDWTGPSLADFYRSVFELRHTQDVLWNGQWGAPQTKLATDGGANVYAFSRSRDGKTVVVVTNFGGAAASVKYSGFSQPGDYSDWFSKSAVTLAATGTIDVPAHGYRVLVR